MKITIKGSPYGDTGKVYEGALGMFQHYILQLSSFRSQNKTPKEREYLEADIRGYEMIVASGSEKNAVKFLELKRDAITFEDRFENNEKLVEYMKANGHWEEK